MFNQSKGTVIPEYAILIAFIALTTAAAIDTLGEVLYTRGYDIAKFLNDLQLSPLTDVLEIDEDSPIFQANFNPFS